MIFSPIIFYKRIPERIFFSKNFALNRINRLKAIDRYFKILVN